MTTSFDCLIRPHDTLRIRRAGFTLVEMLMVVAFMAILAGIILTSVSPTETQNLESVARVLTSDLSLARSAAIQYNTEWAVQFDIANNTYTLVQTGTGAAPPLTDPLGNSASSGYVVKVGSVGIPTGKSNSVKLAAAVLQNSSQSVTDVRFGALGGTGPLRSQNTVIWLTQGAGGDTRFARLTVSWVTGQVWVDRPASLSAANPIKN